MIYVRKHFSGSDFTTEFEYTPNSILVKYGSFQIAISLAQLQARADFDDFTLYTVVSETYPSGLALNAQPNVDIISYFPISKTASAALPAALQKNLLFHIFIPHAGVKSFDECNFIVCSGDSIKGNVEFVEIDVSRTDWTVPKFGVALSGVQQIQTGQVATFSAQLLGYDKKPIKVPAVIFLEATAGYLPASRVQLDQNGYGEFSWRADLLTPGTQPKIKAGFKYFTGVSELILGVTA